ncbi:hypothetical protein DV096_12730 [Bradymonadaceae bacterium TMQ3]|uniref:FHA domain-containing protein n=1 Tax=Lujinxingia sediminis TaxID=2480984 RepID=A0ABY0CRJ7_9DELT|nr:hypothetical protein [Lujinxingia sediminis]RDV37962.1 hypothetical protein DV096_12730 [Bradymonadaceae bacterium TMQ3]RVU42709.1 hypothetical protein EA187_14425 [Lujinxingia sediminis]TXC75259.1 hypothetical protein FRC91_11055 [Bradymonadales bacterium TMQ1]
MDVATRHRDPRLRYAFSGTVSTLAMSVVCTLGVGCAEPGTETSPAHASSQPLVTLERSEPRAEAAADASFKTIEPDREAAARAERLSPERVSEDVLKLAVASPVPVLLPDHDALLATLQLTTGPTWYGASMRGEDFGVVIHGTNARHSLPGSGLKEHPDAQAGRPVLSRTHAIVTVSFESFDVAYSLDIDCQDPLKNPRCAEDAFAWELVEGLKLLGAEATR